MPLWLFWSHWSRFRAWAGPFSPAVTGDAAFSPAVGASSTPNGAGPLDGVSPDLLALAVPGPPEM
eukprot:10999499-Lingulodinium_polyedra.AAC.1